MISVICVTNNREILDDYLLRGLKNQSAMYELIVIDNTDKRFGSAASALNYGAMKAKGEYLMFVHQDVYMSSKSWLEDAEKTLNNISNLGVAGVAGVKDGHGVLSNILHCNPPKRVSEEHLYAPVLVQTLDECVLIVPRNVFKSWQFDALVCDNWHLYGVDYCLTMQEHGLDVVVLPLSLYHSGATTTGAPLLSTRILYSLGGFPVALPGGYYDTLSKLIVKHQKYCPVVYTTCGAWNTGYSIELQWFWQIIENIGRKVVS